MSLAGNGVGLAIAALFSDPKISMAMAPVLRK